MDDPVIRHIGGDFYGVRSKPSSTEYQVDVGAGEYCNCPDWTNRRTLKPLGDPERWCKHMRLVKPAPSRALERPELTERLTAVSRTLQRTIAEREILRIKLEHAEARLRGEDVPPLTEAELYRRLMRAYCVPGQDGVA